VEVVEETEEEEGEVGEEGEEEGSVELGGGALEVVDDALVEGEVICWVCVCGRGGERICYCASVGVSDCVPVCVRKRERVCV